MWRLLALLAFAALAGAGSAVAGWLPMPTVEFATSAAPDGGDGSKTVTKDCAAPARLLGAGTSSNYHQAGNGGAAANPAGGMAAIRSLSLHERPVVGMSAQLVELGARTAGGVGNYTAFGTVVCTPLKLDLELVSARSRSGSSATRSATVTCPAGLALVGAGGGVLSPKGSEAAVVLQELTPKLVTETVGGKKHVRPVAVTASGAETGAGTRSVWSVSVQAICARGKGLPSFDTVVARSAPSAAGAAEAKATCRPGFTPAGALGAVYGLRPGGAALTAVTVAGSAADVTAQAIGRPTKQRWGVVAYAVCIAIATDA